jgi:hypothetical protein
MPLVRVKQKRPFRRWASMPRQQGLEVFKVPSQPHGCERPYAYMTGHFHSTCISPVSSLQTMGPHRTKKNDLCATTQKHAPLSRHGHVQGYKINIIGYIQLESPMGSMAVLKESLTVVGAYGHLGIESVQHHGMRATCTGSATHGGFGYAMQTR